MLPVSSAGSLVYRTRDESRSISKRVQKVRTIERDNIIVIILYRRLPVVYTDKAFDRGLMQVTRGATDINAPVEALILELLYVERRIHYRDNNIIIIILPHDGKYPYNSVPIVLQIMRAV